MQVVDIFRAKIVDVSADSVTVEVTGDENKVDSLYNLLRGFGIREIARTGTIAMTRGSSGSSVANKKQVKPTAKSKK
jgi:acetolactate synthase-1/3 small subunit